MARAGKMEKNIIDEINSQVAEHNGRYYWAWYDEASHQWTAPTPAIGGAYVGSKDYVCSGAAISRARRRDLVRWIQSEID